MIREIGVELQERIRDRGCPLPVVDREQTKTTTWGRERIVIERDEAGDRFDFTRSQRRNARVVAVQLVGAKLTIYAQSGKSGALPFEHERRAQSILNCVIAALSKIQSIRKGRTAFLPDSGAFVVPPDLEASERRNGAVYELKFSFPLAIPDVTFKGEAKPEITDFSFQNCTTVNGTEEGCCEE